MRKTLNLTAKHIIILELILCLGIVVFSLRGAEQWVSRLFYLSFLTLVPGVLFVFRNRNRNTALMLVTLAAALFCVLISALHGEGDISFARMIFLFVFASLLIYIQLMQSTQATKALCDFVMSAGVLMAVIFAGAYYVANVRTEDKFLTMNFSNSNLLGMWLLQAVLFSVLGFFYYRRTLAKVLCLAAAVANSVLMSQSGARNAYLALGMGAAIFLVYFLKKQKISNWVLGIVSVFPVIFLALYMLFYEVWENSELLQMLFLDEGKSMDSRYVMWESSFYNVRGHWVTGTYFTLSGNVHNSHLVLLCSYGIVVLCLTVMYLYRTMKEANRNAETPYQKLCIIAFCITIFMGNAEGSLFSGAVGLYIPACAFLLLARYDQPITFRQSAIDGKNPGKGSEDHGK